MGRTQVNFCVGCFVVALGLIVVTLLFGPVGALIYLGILCVIGIMLFWRQ